MGRVGAANCDVVRDGLVKGSIVCGSRRLNWYVGGTQVSDGTEQECLQLCAEACRAEYFMREPVADHGVLVQNTKPRLAYERVSTQEIHGGWLCGQVKHRAHCRPGGRDGTGAQ